MSLPPALREFLHAKGAGTYGNVKIYQPEQVDGLYREFFDDPSELFTVYLPFGERTHEQEMLIYRITDNTYASIWHETVPDAWSEEDWLPFGPDVLGEITGGG